MAFRLRQDECDARGVVRAVREQVIDAIDALVRGGDNVEAVHTARRCIKQARSALRLIRRDQPERFDREDDALRDAAQTLAPLRDQQVLRRVLDERFAEQPGYDEARAALRENGAAEVDPAQTRDAAADALEQLRRCLARLEAPLDAGGADTLTTGWRRTLRRARRARKAAKRSRAAEDLHTLRKRMKDYDYQARLLRDVIEQKSKQRKRARRVTEYLGDHHDLSLLHQTLRQSLGDDEHGERLLEAIDRRRDKLADKALKKTKRLLRSSSDRQD
jgi:CHAD domain-containing protein